MNTITLSNTVKKDVCAENPTTLVLILSMTQCLLGPNHLLMPYFNN